jgi:hypothetical protein
LCELSGSNLTRAKKGGDNLLPYPLELAETTHPSREPEIPHDLISIGYETAREESK